MSSEPSTNNPYYTPLSEKQIREKRIRARRRLITIFFSLVGLTAAEWYFLNQKAPISDNITVLLLFNVILIFLFLLVVLIVRNLVQIYNERKSKILGSRFQAKLILAFLTLALVPSVLLFFVASKLFSYSIGSWFSIQVEESLQQSMEVAREYYGYVERKGLVQAKNIETRIAQDRLYLQDNRQRLQRLVETKVKEYELGAIIVYDHHGKVVVTHSNPSTAQEYTSGDFIDLIGESTGEEGVSELRSFGAENYLAVMLPLAEQIEGKTSVWGYILTLSEIPQKTLQKIQNIRTMFEDYKKQSLLKLPVSANYFVTFLMITLLILFSAIWLGFYMARGITIPIQQLAEGTRRVAEGELNVKIGVTTTDEIGLLISSFNKMTDDLSENRIKIETAHQDLQNTNIELERRRYYIETILANIGAGVVSIDKKGKITTFNKAAEKILDYPKPDILGSSYKDAFSSTLHNPIRKLIHKMTSEDKEFSQEQVELTLGEDHLTLLVNIKFLNDDSGHYLGLLIVFEDLTQLIKAQKVAAWKEVAQGIAHEIKNPLTPIQLNTQRLRKKYYEDKEGFALVFDESIKIITQEVEGMKQLLNEFLKFSRMPTPQPRPISIHEIIQDVMALYRDHDKNIQIKTQFDPNILMSNLDPEQIRRVFINLFENSLDAVDPGGIIEIKTFLNGPRQRVRIDFSDNGKGINPQDQDKLFLPHFTTKKRGTGLGLAIVSRIIIDHSGWIQVRANSPQGTVFSIELPHSSQSTTSGKVA